MNKTFEQLFNEKLKLTIELNELVKEQNRQPKTYTPELTKLRNFTRSQQFLMRYYTVVLYACKLQEEGKLTPTDQRDLKNPKFIEEVLDACRDIASMKNFEVLPEKMWKKVIRIANKHYTACHEYVETQGLGSQFF